MSGFVNLTFASLAGHRTQFRQRGG